jgi:hypothetical protein
MVVNEKTNLKTKLKKSMADEDWKVCVVAGIGRSGNSTSSE